MTVNDIITSLRGWSLSSALRGPPGAFIIKTLRTWGGGRGWEACVCVVGWVGTGRGMPMPWGVWVNAWQERGCEVQMFAPDGASVRCKGGQKPAWVARVSWGNHYQSIEVLGLGIARCVLWSVCLWVGLGWSCVVTGCVGNCVLGRAGRGLRGTQCQQLNSAGKHYITS